MDLGVFEDELQSHTANVVYDFVRLDDTLTLFYSDVSVMCNNFDV